MKVSELNTLDRVLVIGSNLRKEHPLLAQRVRQAVNKNGAELNVISSLGDDFLVRTQGFMVVAPSRIADAVAAVTKAAAQLAGNDVPPEVMESVVDDDARTIAQSLLGGTSKAILLGDLVQHGPERSRIHALAILLGRITGCRVGFLGDGANSVGGYLSGAIPNKPSGRDAAEMIRKPLKAYFLLHSEVEFDCALPRAASAAMHGAELVVAMSPFKHGALDYAQVLLPIAPFTETAGTFVNIEGRVQRFNGVVPPLGDTRPGWKVLRVLGNLLHLDGFDYESIEDVRKELDAQMGDVASRLSNNVPLDAQRAATDAAASRLEPTSGLERIGEVPIYQTDAIVRRASSLQQTRDARVDGAWMNANLMQRLGLRQGDRVRVSQDGGAVTLNCYRDDRLPDDCVRVATANAATVQLGAAFGRLNVERLASTAEVER